jgi:hypothetical protein
MPALATGNAPTKERAAAPRGRNAATRDVPDSRAGRAPPTAASTALALRVVPPDDRTEAQASRFASTGYWGTAVAPDALRAVPEHLIGPVGRAVAGPGRSLDPDLRDHFERKLGVGLGAARVHTDADASASARALGAWAYTYGSDIVFSPGSYKPTSATGRELIAHEVAHVAQQTSRTPVLAASPDIGFWDVVDVVAGPVVGETGRASGASGEDVGRYVLGDTVWGVGETILAVLQAFGSGVMKGLRSTPKEELKRIKDKFDNFGMADAFAFTQGYSLGVLKGMWYELTDLFEAIKTLIELPAAINEFLIHTLPQLAIRLTQAINAPGGLGDQLTRLSNAFKKDPEAFMAQVEKLFATARAAILAAVEKRGEGLGRQAMDLLDEPWGEIGDKVGAIAGRVLFEVLLAVGTDAIGNLVKEGAVVAGKIVEGAVDAVRGLGGVLRTLLEWLEGMVRGIAGAGGELFDALREFVAGLRKLVGELGEMEAVSAEGVRVRVPAAEAGKGTAMEARALERPPGSPTVDDLYGRSAKTAEVKAPEPAKPPRAPRVKRLSMGEKRSSGAQWFLRNADRAEVEASQKGYQVYEYYNREGRCLYVGRSGGAAETKATRATKKALEAPKKATSWVDRGWSHIQEERREIAEADRIVVHAELTEMEASALEHDRIAELNPTLNVKKGEFGSRAALGPDYAANVQSAQKQPTFRFETEIVPPTR